MARALNKQDIPSDLWHSNTFRMPAYLVDSYRDLLNEYGVYNDALDLERGGQIVGGKTPQETLDHFARRYGVNSCRIESILLDPCAAFTPISEDLIYLFSEGNIALLDVACGSGSVGASILTTLSVLRRKNVLPKTPMFISIFGIDCSITGLEIYKKMMMKLQKDIELAGIDSELKTSEWFAEESTGTARMFDLWFANNPNADVFVAFAADLSGFMAAEFEKYAHSVQHMFDRAYNNKCAIHWVEPGKYNKADKLFDKLNKQCNSSLWRQAGPFKHDYTWFHPFQQRNRDCRVLLRKYIC